MNLQEIVRRTVEQLGYEFVDLEVSGRARLLRVFLDRHPAQGQTMPAPGEGLTIDDCVAVSNQLSRVLEVEGVDYDRLEVSSPGLDRPLRSRDDFRRFMGSKATISLRVPMNGRKRFVGTLVGLDDVAVAMDLEGVAVQLPLGDIDKARLVPEF